VTAAAIFSVGGTVTNVIGSDFGSSGLALTGTYTIPTTHNFVGCALFASISSQPAGNQTPELISVNVVSATTIVVNTATGIGVGTPFPFTIQAICGP
jgi:hypothetical protein